MRVTFPAGYAAVEHLPEAYTIVDPTDASRVWYDFWVSSECRDRGTPQARAEVELVRATAPHAATHLARDYAPLLKDWSRTAAARANRTITVRRTP